MAPSPSTEEHTEDVKRTVVMTEIDTKIRERIIGQPQSLDDIDVKVSAERPQGLHRLSLFPEFEQYSYDCTRGDSCKFHRREVEKRNGVVYVKILNHGKYAFRWLLKNNRAIDDAINVRGWYLANRALFPEVPKMLFSVSGGVELGDSILACMPIAKALAIRNAPSVRSKELLRSRMTTSRKKPNQVLMSGNPEDPNTYMPDLGKEAADKGEGISSAPGSMEEGRDF